MLSLIIPVYNEEGSLPGLFDAIEAVAEDLPELEVILVDDGSSDRSGELLAAQAKKDARFKVLRLAVNRGQTAAIQAGIDHASGETLVFMDSDLQNDPADIPRLLEKISQGYDVVSGWRTLKCPIKLPYFLRYRHCFLLPDGQ